MLLKKKRFVPLLVLLLCTTLLLSVPMTAAAAEAVTNFSSFTYADKFTAEYVVESTSGSASVEGKVLTIKATGVNKTSDCGSTATPSTTTVTLKAKETVSVTLSHYTNVTLGPPGEVTNNADGSKTFTMTAESTVTFSVTASNATEVSGEVTFVGVESTQSKVPSDSATYMVGSSYYSYLDKAITAAGSSGTIVVVNNGKVYHSTIETDADYANKTFTFNIPDGVVLLVPFDSANTLIKDDMSDNMHNDHTTFPTSTAFRVLTMPKGTTINVQSGGAISVGSRASNQMVGQVGSYGAIKMDSGSNITLEGGSNLYAWGYILPGDNGAGTVTAQSDSTVYESTAIMDYPGSASSVLALYDDKGSDSPFSVSGGGIFPLRSYTMRNVEVPTTFISGAKNIGFYSVYSGTAGKAFPNTLTLISNDSNGVFNLSQGATLVKSFSDGTQYVDSTGTVSINGLSVTIRSSIASVTINSTKTSGLPIPTGWEVSHTGDITLNGNLVFTEGSKFTLHSGTATIPSGKSLYIMDAADDRGAYMQLTHMNGSTYGTLDSSNTDSDAVLDINGTFSVAGSIYTSSGKAAIVSSEGTGSIQYTGTSTATSVKHKYSQANGNFYADAEGNSVSDDVAITPAYLKNNDGNHTAYNIETNNTYTNIDGYWHKGTDHVYTTKASSTKASDATCTEPAKYYVQCDYCPSVHNTLTVASGEKNPNKHTGTEAWTQTETQHTKAYSCCGAVTVTTEAHEWSDGVCSECGYICEHSKSSTDAAEPPTCTEPGLSEGSHCETCGEVLVAQEVVDALGHSYSYTDNGDGTHTYTCEPCGGNGSEAHSYENGWCVCGAQEPLEIYGASVNLGNELSMKFFVKKSAVDNFYSGDQLFIRVTKEYADGRENVVEETYLSDWSDYNSSFYCVTFSDISAKEMTDMLYVQIFYAAAEGEEAVAASPVWEDSMRNYSMRGLTNGTFDDLVCRLVVDMLNYGAAAQEEFGYGVDDLATSELTDEQKAMATQEAITCTNGRTKSDNCVGSNLNLGSALTMSVFFREITTDMRAEITYTNYKDVEKIATVDGSNFVLYGTDMYRIYVNETVVADVNELVTVSVYDGEECVAWCTDSIESNIARGEADKPVYEMIMKFAASAKQYFLNRGY